MGGPRISIGRNLHMKELVARVDKFRSAHENSWRFVHEFENDVEKEPAYKSVTIVRLDA